MKAQSDKPPHRARWPAGLAAILAATLLLGGTAWGNNLVIENIELTGFNDTEHYVLVQFDLRWENSWRLGPETGPANYDAAWVFVKFKWGGVWQHAALNDTGHSISCNVPAVVDMPPDRMGVFVYRTDVGMGDVVCDNMQLRWNYGENSIEDDEGNIDITIHGIEMVYIPEGAFYVGDGSTTNIRGQLHDASDPTQPFLITSEDAITMGGTAPGNMGNNDGVGMDYGPDDFNNSVTQVLPAAFPKGYAAFYIMKYELTQGQYADFYNGRNIPVTITTYGQYRHTIHGTYPNLVADVPNRAAGYMAYGNGAAYADWAGMRPMTELEFEKAARGTRLPVPGEYAWGSTGAHSSRHIIVNDGTPDAVIGDPGVGIGNGHFHNTDPWWPSRGGPLRVGIFAASFPNAAHARPPTRVEAGASFYGAMELSGHLNEIAITIGCAQGRAFDGAHGDGLLGADGLHNVTSWPLWHPPSGKGWSNFVGGSMRTQIMTQARISDRYFRAYAGQKTEYEGGFRAVRTAH